MDPGVAEDRESQGDSDDEENRGHGAHAERDPEALRRQDAAEDIEPDIVDEGEDEDEGGACVAELGPRLDELRQSQVGSLCRVEGCEDRAERRAEHGGGDRRPQITADGDAEEADGDGAQVRVARDPHGREVPDPSVPFRDRHVVDRPALDDRSGRRCLIRARP
ncbi:Uncharacterised protein [Mycobacteroides abscessus subsp. abscessus]|nr:Uncharacterised protein [Mycobacteroides abscessus subsp. abscessus]